MSEGVSKEGGQRIKGTLTVGGAVVIPFVPALVKMAKAGDGRASEKLLDVLKWLKSIVDSY